MERAAPCAPRTSCTSSASRTSSSSGARSSASPTSARATAGDKVLEGLGLLGEHADDERKVALAIVSLLDRESGAEEGRRRRPGAGGAARTISARSSSGSSARKGELGKKWLSYKFAHADARRAQPGRSCAARRRCMPEMIVGPHEHRRERDGFRLTDRRMALARGARRGRLLPLLPRSRQGLLLQGPARRQDAAPSSPTRSASSSTAARSTRRSPRCT